MVKAPADKELALALVEEIVAAQGTVFVKEFLRAFRRDGRRVQIGRTKPEVLQNLTDAVEDESIKLEDLQAWLDETEGWGREHAYLFRATRGVLQSALWRARSFEDEVRRRGLTIPRTRAHLLRFPDTLTLSDLTFDGQQLRAKWQKGGLEWQRDSGKDYVEEIEGDTIEFRAWRQMHKRTVVRFLFDRARAMAALFVQLPLGDEHNDAIAIVQRTVNQLFAFRDLEVVRISDAIKGLDRMDAGDAGAGGERIRSQETRFRAQGATVQFGADAELESYLDVGAVRRVRHAVRLDEFTGELARFRLQLELSTGSLRWVTMSLDGLGNRVYFFSQMTADQVWTTLDTISQASR